MTFNPDEQPVDEKLKHLYATKQHVACLERCREILSTEPLHFQALYCGLETAYDLGMHEESLVYCDTFIHAFTDTFFRIWTVRGSALMSLDRHDEAIESFRRSLQLEPADVPTWSFLALEIYQKKGREKAITLLDTAEVEFDLQNEFEFVRGHIERNDGNHTEALTHFTMAQVFLDPSNPDYDAICETIADELGKTLRFSKDDTLDG